MRTVEVKTEKPYKIYVGSGLLDEAGRIAENSLGGAEKVLIVADSVVAPLYLRTVRQSLGDAGFAAFSISFPAGETSKNFDTYRAVVSTAATLGFTRGDALIALGGGVTGDLTGFAAATYMRGIKYIQMPTTLLGGIDASVGGKTGVDLPEGKNLAGAFWQPEAVIFDTDTLDTLPEAELNNGLGEGVKYAVLCGGRIAEILDGGLNKDNMEEFCALCAGYKADVVSRDEKENGIRTLLNLGHTAGHAEEAVSGYTISHGAAVADGIKIMAEAAERHGELSGKDCAFIISLLEKYKLGSGIVFPSEDILPFVAHDKKMRKDGINAVVIRGIGDCRVRKMSLREFGEYIK
jgi:3-dehydroquinate synthase